MAGIIFAKGHLYADPDGGNIEFAELQDVSFEVRDTTKQARGPESAFPLASEIADRSMSLRASFLKVQAQGLNKVLGGTVSYANNETTIAVGKTSLPSTFKCVLKSPSDGSDFELVLYKVRPMNLTMPFAMRDFSIPNFEAEVMVDESNGDKVCDIILPGYQSVN
ncbi:MAG: hypothetical protein ACYC2Y_10945 [Armatimonadota bacterium]